MKANSADAICCASAYPAHTQWRPKFRKHDHGLECIHFQRTVVPGESEQRRCDLLRQRIPGAYPMEAKTWEAQLYWFQGRFARFYWESFRVYSLWENSGTRWHMKANGADAFLCQRIPGAYPVSPKTLQYLAHTQQKHKKRKQDWKAWLIEPRAESLARSRATRPQNIQLGAPAHTLPHRLLMAGPWHKAKKNNPYVNK